MSYSLTDQFVQQYLPYAQSVSVQTGLPTDYILAQSALETGWGSSNAANSLNNFFGISPGGSLASYSSAASGFSAFGNLMNSPNYSGWSSLSNQSPSNIASYMQGQGYAADPNYASQISGLVPQIDQALSSIGASGSNTNAATTSATNNGAGATGSSTSGVLGSVSSWISGYAIQGGLVIVAVMLLLGSVFIFARQSGNE